MTVEFLLEQARNKITAGRAFDHAFLLILKIIPKKPLSVRLELIIITVNCADRLIGAIVRILQLIGHETDFRLA